MLALREAVMYGVIDCITSHHLPQDWDDKTCEFEYAKAGMIGLQTCYAAVQTTLPELSAEQIANLFSLNAGKIFQLENTSIKEGNRADITLFNTNEFVFTKEKNKSKSFNTPLFNVPLHGNVIGIISKGELILNK